MISEALKTHISSRVIEIYLNGFNHARSPIGVFSCGQRFPNLEELKLAFVDFGVGIPATVRAYLDKPTMTSKNALEWAFTPGHTTRDIIDNVARGNGLKLLNKFIEANNGKLEIYSDTGYARIGIDQPYFADRTIIFQGTFVQITLKCDSKHYTLANEEDFDSEELLF